MISVAEAQAKILEGLKPLAAEQISLGAALGRVLAADAAATLTAPPSDMSAMDGYAVRAQDVAALPATLKVTGMAAAGAAFAGSVGRGEAVRIFTGAPVPKGATTIVIQENTTTDGDKVTVTEGAAPAGRHIRRAGLDFKKGDKLLHAGQRLTARDIALAAAMNHAALPCTLAPRIAILATGDELVPPGAQPGPSQIVSSSAAGISACAMAWGANVRELGIARDTLGDIREKAAAASGCDVLVTIGGASVGEHDLVQKALAGDLKVAFWKVAMRPGKPLIHGRFKGIPFLGLPGNPVSAMVCALLFLKPLIFRLGGVRETPWNSVSAALSTPLAANDSRQDYVRCALRTDASGQAVAEPFPVQDSSMLRPFAAADGLIERPPGDPARTAGDKVTVLRLD